MQYLHSLQHLADELDQNGFYQQADRIDRFLEKFGQVKEDDPVKTSSENIARTTLLMFQKLQDLYARFLPDFDYLGKNNLTIIQAAFDHTVTLFKTVMRDISAEYDQAVVDNYEAHLKNVATELQRSMKMRITPAKVKIDKFYLYEELEILVRKLERLYDKGKFAELAPVIRKARSVRDSFGNVIKQVSEQIANADLIEIS